MPTKILGWAALPLLFLTAGLVILGRPSVRAQSTVTTSGTGGTMSIGTPALVGGNIRVPIMTTAAIDPYFVVNVSLNFDTTLLSSAPANFSLHCFTPERARAHCGRKQQPTPSPTDTPTPLPSATSSATPTSTTESVISLKPSREIVPLAAGSAAFQVEIGSASNVAAFQFLLRYDPSVLTLPTVQVGPFLGSTGRQLFCPAPVVDGYAGPGTLLYGCATVGFGPGVDGSGVLATVRFSLASAGSTSISLEQIMTGDALGDSLCPCLGVGASVDVTAVTGTATDTPMNAPTSTNTATPTPTDTAVPTATSSPTPRPVCVGDVNGDGVVNVRDLVLVARHTGTNVGDRRYNSTYDLNHDGRITVRDVMMILERLGATCP
jgi:hypothetical protein